MTGFDGTATVPVGDHELAYREQGQGQPVVFVHGDLRDLRAWEAQLSGVGAAHRAIAYSRRYARPNDDIPPGADNPMQPHVDDLIRFLQEVDAAPAHLAGNSWGGFVCLLAAAQRPDLVRTLTLMEPPVLTLVTSAQPGPLDLARLLLRDPRTGAAVLKFGATALAPAQKAFGRDQDEKAMVAFARGVLGKDHFEATPDERLEQSRENRGALKAFLLGDGFPPLPEETVRSIAAPTLLITGGDSPPFFRRLTERLEELLPQSEHVEIPGASHMMFEEDPDAVNEAILYFIARRAGAAGAPA